MSAPVSSSSDFLLSKPDVELLYLVQHPDFYHPDLITAARQELGRRGVSIPRPAVEPVSSEAPVASPEGRSWPWPILGGGLTVLVVAVLLWPSKTQQPKPVAPAKPAELVSVATHQLPSFDSLTRAQLLKMPATLPAAELADTTAKRKFLLLARRFWEAENQTSYLFDQVVVDKLDASFPGQVDLTLDKWRRLTSVLVYDHKLPPVMSRELALMRRVALIRRSTLEAQRGSYEAGAQVLTDYSMLMNDSVLYVRQGLLGVPQAQRLKPGTVTQRKPSEAPDVEHVAILPPPRPGYNPLYVLDGELLPSDPQTGEAPHKVSQLPPEAIASITLLNAKTATEAFGPRAHAGAVVVTTKQSLAEGEE